MEIDERPAPEGRAGAARRVVVLSRPVRAVSVMGESLFRIREARREDLAEIMVLAEAHRQELGLMSRHRQWLVEQLNRGEIFVAEAAGQEVVGFVIFHHHRHTEDEETTVLYICTDSAHRRNGIGKMLVEAVAADARLYRKSRIIIRCPVQLAANRFYWKIGCQLKRRGAGRGEDCLNVWELPLFYEE
jgi:ribosomal protein S18 acetylase RimI-like enzyme